MRAKLKILHAAQQTNVLTRSKQIARSCHSSVAKKAGQGSNPNYEKGPDMPLPQTRSVHRGLAFATIFAGASATFAPPVAAADMPIKAAPPPVVVGSWTGFYVGAHGGWGWADTHVPSAFSNNISGSFDVLTNGPLAGVQVGANWQSGNVVLGVELDGSWTFLRSNSNGTQPIPSTTTRDLIDIQGLGTATGRIGYAMNSWLFYGKAGIAAGSVTITSPDFAEPPTWQRGVWGPTAGAGLEVAFLHNVSAKLEYDFLYFVRDSIPYFPNQDPVGIDHSVQMVKAGINVHFGGAPSLPRY